MTMENEDPRFEALVDEYVRTGKMPALDNLDQPSREEAESLLHVAEMIWELGSGAPALEADPVAAELGLVPDPNRALDSRALKAAMNKAGLRASDVASRLKRREWEVETRDVFAWTSRGGLDVPPALVRALAEILNTSAQRLTSERRPTSLEEALRELVQTPAFESLAQRWALIQRSSLAAARATLAARVPAAVNRGSHPDLDQMLASLAEVVSISEMNQRDQDSR
jgi:hypothetical protein